MSLAWQEISRFGKKAVISGLTSSSGMEFTFTTA